MKYLIWTKNWKSRYVAPNEVNTLEEWYTIETREVNPSEYEELGIATFVSIKIPLQVFSNSEDLQKKLLNISLLFSEIQRKTRDWVIVLNNINLKDIPEFLNKAEYTELKSVWVVFSEEIDDLFTEKEEDEETTTE